MRMSLNPDAAIIENSDDRQDNDQQIDPSNSRNNLKEDNTVPFSVPEFPRFPRVHPHPQSVEIHLKSIVPFNRNYSAWLSVAISTSIMLFTLFYTWNASFPFVRRILWQDPNTSIFTINILSHITLLWLESLIRISFDNMKWKLSCRRDGISPLEFAALAESTGPVGLIRLLFYRSAKKANSVDSGRKLNYHFWSIQRYVRA